MAQNKILLVDDEEIIRDSFREWLTQAGFDVLTAPGGAAAIEILRGRNDIDIMVADLKMPDMDGMILMKEAKKIASPLAVIIMTAYGSVDSAVAAMKAGACDYLLKPFPTEKLEEAIRKIRRERKTQ